MGQNFRAQLPFWTFAANAHDTKHQKTCYEWLSNTLTASAFKNAVASQLQPLFKKRDTALMVPSVLLTGYFEDYVGQERKSQLYKFSNWIFVRSENFPNDLLVAIKIMLEVIQSRGICRVAACACRN